MTLDKQIISILRLYYDESRQNYQMVEKRFHAS